MQADNSNSVLYFNAKTEAIQYRTCSYAEHKDPRIVLFCTQDSCANNRLLCLSCFCQFHKGHDVSPIDDTKISQLHYLKLNTNSSQSTKVLQSIASCCEDIQKTSLCLGDLIAQELQKALSNISFQINALNLTFESNTCNSAIQTMTSQSNDDKNGIEQIIKMIKFLKKSNAFKSPQELKQLAQRKKNEIIFIITETIEQLRPIMKKFSKKVSQITFIEKDNAYKRGRKQKDKQLARISTNDCQTEQKDLSSKDYIKKKFVNNEKDLIMKEVRSAKANKTQKNKIEQEKSQKQSIKVSTPIKSNKNSIERILTPIAKNKIIFDNQISSQNLEKDQEKIISSYKKKDFSLIIQAQNERIVNQILKKHIDQKENVNQITIMNDSRDYSINQQTIRILAQGSKSVFKHLKKFSAAWANLTYKSQIIKIAMIFPELQQLVVSCCDSYDYGTLQKISQYIPNVKRLHLGIDTLNQLEMSHIDQQFFGIKRNQSLAQEQLLKIPKLFKNLQNMQISKFNSQKCYKIIKDVVHLKELSIGCDTNNCSQNPSINSQLFFQAISFKPVLLCLSLNSINISKMQISLLKMLKNLQLLKVLCLLDVNGVTNNAIKIVSQKCLQLRKLSLFNLDLINGQNIWNIKGLQFLMISACWKINYKSAIENIKKMKELKYLNISHNCSFTNNYDSQTWVTTALLREIKNLPQLQHLFISNNLIGDYDLSQMGKINKLKTFICGGTNITGNGLIKFTKQNPNITKLSIFGLNGLQMNDTNKKNKSKRIFYGNVSNDQFGKILNNLQGLTHINTQLCSNINLNDFIMRIKSLKCLSIQSTSLRRKGIFMYLNDQE